MDQMKNITTYEYKEITVRSDKASLYLDCYESFGWKQDENFPPLESGDKVTLKLKRDRRLVNKVELTCLQRNFEAAMNEIIALEHSKTTAAIIWALCIGLVGTAFVAGSVFCRRASPCPALHRAGGSGFCGLDRTLFCLPHPPGQKDPAGKSVY